MPIPYRHQPNLMIGQGSTSESPYRQQPKLLHFPKGDLLLYSNFKSIYIMKCHWNYTESYAYISTNDDIAIKTA